MSGEKLNYGAEFHSYLEGLSAALATSDRQAVELALEKFKNLEAYTTKIRTLQSIIDGKDFILGLWDDIQAAVMSGSLEELEEAKISIPASGKALFENALIEAEKSIASHIEEETQEETAEESSFENWNASYVLESRSILNDISKIKSAADISALLERVEALRENFDDATFLFLNEPEAARKFEILDGSLKRLEIRVHELQHRIPVLRLDEAISQLNNYQDHPDFKRQAQRLIEELDEFYEAAKTHFHRTLDKELKKEYKKLHGLLEISADEFKVELEEKTTLWVTRIEAIPAVESFVDFIEDLDTSTVEYQDIATVLTELSQKETRFIAAAQAEFDQEDEDLFVLQQLYVDTYQRKASELKKKLEVVKNTPAEVQALEQVIVQITSELDRAEVDDTLPFDVEENLRLLNQKKSAFDPLYKEKVFEAEYQVKAKNLVSGYIKLEKRINNFSNKQEREATRQFLTIPEVATIVPLIEAIKKISREDIEPHARSTRRHTYNSEQLTVLFDDLQAAIDACNALGMFDEGNPFFNDKSEQIKKRALDLGDTSYQILDRLQGFITHSETPARKEDPNRMKVRAIVGELLTIIFGHDPRINSLKNEFLNKIGDVANTKLANFYRLQVGIQEVSVAGDPGKIDFGVYFDAIMPTLSDKYVSFLGMARALLLNPKTAEKGARVLTATERDSILMEESENLKVENEDMNKAEIDTHMIRVYDYILVRIKGKFATKDERERAGLYLPTTEEIDSKYDRTKPYDQWSKEEKKEFNEEFDYNHLSEDAVGDFIAHLKIEFDSLLSLLTLKRKKKRSGVDGFIRSFN